MVVLMHHVIIEPLWCCHLLYRLSLSSYSAPSSCPMLQLNSIPHFAVENNHPPVPIVTIPYHIIYKSRHSYHLPIPKHPQFRAAEIQNRILGALLFFCREKQQRVLGFSHHRRRRRRCRTTKQLCDDVSFSIPHTTPPPKLFTPSPQSHATFGFGLVAESSPPSKCFLCLELFVLVLGVGYSFSTILFLTHSLIRSFLLSLSLRCCVAHTLFQLQNARYWQI